MKRHKQLIGVISDTHGLMRPEVAGAFKGAHLIIHAGDIGGADVLDQLGSMAPVVAVRGNNDKDRWARAIPETELIEIGKLRILILHDVKELPFRPADRHIHIVISGHSHRPLIDRRDGILFLNPGSAGPRRFKLPVTVARLSIDGADADPEIIDLFKQIRRKDGNPG